MAYRRRRRARRTTTRSGSDDPCRGRSCSGPDTTATAIRATSSEIAALLGVVRSTCGENDRSPSSGRQSWSRRDLRHAVAVKPLVLIDDNRFGEAALEVVTAGAPRDRVDL